MKVWLRGIGAVLAGLVLAMILAMALEGVAAAFFPFPEGADTSDPEVVREHVAKCPQWILAMTVVWWGAAVFAGCWLATRLGTNRHPAHGFVVGVLLFALTCLNMYLLPYPVWFEIANVIVYPLATMFGVKKAGASKAS